MNKNQKQLESFTTYCKEYPEQRFWQALRNWTRKQKGYEKVNFILTAELNDDLYDPFEIYNNITDTFYD